MNLSGEAIEKIRAERKDLENLVVIHDDLDLPFGKIKIKNRGGDGGHNGIKSIITSLNSNNFFRIKVGIGRPEKREEVVNYVLSDFSEEELIMLKNIRKKVANLSIILAITLNINLAYNYLNGSN